MPTTNAAEHSAWTKRPVFRPRQMLTAHQLNEGLEDEARRERLLNRAVHGYGVVVGYGLVVADDGRLVVTGECVELTGGLALDRHGRTLYWKGGHIGPSDIVGRLPTAAGRYTLSAHFAAHPPEADGCLPFAGERAQWWREGVVFTLRPGCEPADRRCPTHPEGACIGHDAYVCRRTGARPGADPGSVPVSPDIGWLLAEPPRELCATGLDGWQYDPDPQACVPIACVEICDLAEAGCAPRYGFATETPEVCAVRPFVYRNPLLYELVKGCDVRLPRVESISWQDWIDRGWRDRIPWAEFAERIAEGLEIRFTRPIRTATIHDASIFVTALIQEDRADYWVGRILPMELVPLDEEGEMARGVRLVSDPRSDWLAAEVTGQRSTLFRGARFEVTIRGQLLRDACGRMLDARPLDIALTERGHERPGGDFVSAFRVARRHSD